MKNKKKVNKYARKKGFASAEYLGVWREMDIYQAMPEPLKETKEEDEEGADEPPAQEMPEFIVDVEGTPLMADPLDTFAILRHFHR